MGITNSYYAPLICLNNQSKTFQKKPHHRLNHSVHKKTNAFCSSLQSNQSAFTSGDAKPKYSQSHVPPAKLQKTEINGKLVIAEITQELALKIKKM